MKVLIACECSGVVRDAFIRRGHDAISCDLKPTRLPGPHYLGDVRDILHKSWDLMIAHPVCKIMANSGVRWLHERPERWGELDKSCEFFNLFRDAAHIPKRCIENSIMHKYAIERIGRRQDQVVQPWWFGDPFTKAAALWLYGLPKLKRKFKKTDYEKITPKCWLMPPSPEREELRSTTEPCFADAMAELWGTT